MIPAHGSPMKLAGLLSLALLLMSTQTGAWSRQAVQDPELLKKQAEDLADAGKFAEAAATADRAVAAYEASRGPDDPGLVSYLALAGTMHQRIQDFGPAERLFQREVSLRERAVPPNDAALAGSLTRLAEVKRNVNQVAQAEELLKRALTLLERVGGTDSVDVATLLSNLGNLQLQRGDAVNARTSVSRALSIYEAQGRANTLNYARLLAVQASIETRTGNFAQARDLLERSLALRDQLKASPAEIAPALNGLATIHQELGELDRAAVLHQRLLEIYDAPSAPQPLNAANTSINLAMLKLLKGDLAGAEPLYARALSLREGLLGPDHPDVAAALERIAVFKQVAGKPIEALASMERATNIIEANLRTILLTGSEQQRLNFMTTVQENLDIALSLRQAVLGSNADASKWAATLVLRRKGRVLDAMTTTLDRLAGRITRRIASC